MARSGSWWRSIGRAALGRLLGDLLPLGRQAPQVPGQLVGAGAVGGGADDEAVLRRADLVEDLAQPLALVVGQALGDAVGAGLVRDHDHEPPGQAHLLGEAGALGPDRVLGHLDDDRLAVAQEPLDLGAAALDLALVEGDVVAVQHPVLGGADVDEGGLHARAGRSGPCPGRCCRRSGVEVSVGPGDVVLDQAAALEDGDLGGDAGPDRTRTSCTGRWAGPSGSGPCAARAPPRRARRAWLRLPTAGPCRPWRPRPRPRPRPPEAGRRRGRRPAADVPLPDPPEPPRPRPRLRRRRPERRRLRRPPAVGTGAPAAAQRRPAQRSRVSRARRPLRSGTARRRLEATRPTAPAPWRRARRLAAEASSAAARPPRRPAAAGAAESSAGRPQRPPGRRQERRTGRRSSRIVRQPPHGPPLRTGRRRRQAQRRVARPPEPARRAAGRRRRRVFASAAGRRPAATGAGRPAAAGAAPAVSAAARRRGSARRRAAGRRGRAGSGRWCPSARPPAAAAARPDRPSAAASVDRGR